MLRSIQTIILLLFTLSFTVGCTVKETSEDEHNSDKGENTPHSVSSTKSAEPRISTVQQEAINASATPDSIPVLVNKLNPLPDKYRPDDLVYPNVPFIFKERIEKRMMREEAAHALENLFKKAGEDDIKLAGVSAFRSQETQESIFNNYVKKDGLEKAKTYSAYPGTSEHQTGLAIDISDINGSCAAEECFGQTKEAEWLSNHASDYGFIIRYPEGKREITGYKYEAWHIRYVGIEIAKEIETQGMTLEEYYNVQPVSK
ncbi:M15 family metallopeptidase [Bacillus sp. SD075]|uniref:M15 family metallopeptidase n=1 Tax=Bacillus sp. SD075 TaxID=2781732 RepID=UPI001A95E8F0|nr:M15 family metallopeptidase [Bacillus sp. SD075]MBO0997510.1 M15 family metallopeptidase [Bacillus sp. SD075]